MIAIKMDLFDKPFFDLKNKHIAKQKPKRGCLNNNSFKLYSYS
jgi:hypothetical protein